MSSNSSNRKTLPGDAGDLKRLGKYVIVKRLGVGGMGTVYLAEDEDLKRTVALKVLPQERASNPILVKRFKSEGQAAATLEHKNIVRVFDAGEADGHLYLALEYVDGVDVLEWMRKRGIIPVSRSIEIIRQVADALDHAWSKNIVHRDIKPSNLMIARDGTVKLTDMGLARSVDETLDTSITRDGTTVGTVDYMPPEQAVSSRAADIRSDIYSLGCTWYHMLTGKPPFHDGNLHNKLAAHQRARRPDPREINDRVSEAIVAVMHRMMAIKPADRYQTPKELLEDLKSDAIRLGGDPSRLLAVLTEDKDDDEPVTLDVDSDGQSWDELSESPTDFNPGHQPEEHPQTKRIKSTKKKKSPPASKAKAPRRTSNTESADQDQPSQSGKYRKVKQPAGAEKAVRKPRKKSAVKERRAQDANEELPQKHEGPLAAPLKSVDIDVLRMGLLGIGAAIFFGIVWWAIQNMGDSGTSNIDPYAGSNPTAQLEANDRQPAGAAPVEETEKQGTESNSDQENQSTVQLRQVDFPGLDDLQDDPQRLARMIPEWMQSLNVPRQAKVIQVGRGLTGSLRTSTLQQALSQIGADTETIEFSQSSVFSSRPIELPVRERLTIRAAQGTQPVIHLDAQSFNEAGIWLRTSVGQLSFEGLHLVISAPPANAQLITVNAGTLQLKNCSITVLGERHVDVVSAESSDKPVHVVMQNVIARGDDLTIVHARQPAMEFVGGNNLLISREGPLFQLTATSQKNVHSTRFSNLASTLISGESITLLNGREQLENLEVNIQFHRSLALGLGNSSTAFQFANWPSRAESDLDSPQALATSLESTHTIFGGWNQLVRQTTPQQKVMNVADATTWRQFWLQTLPSGDWMPDWTLDRDINDLSLAEIDQTLRPIAAGGVGSRAQIGADATSLTALPDGYRQRYMAATQINEIPDDFVWSSSKTVKRFDLLEAERFMKFLADCPDGSTVQCFGSGLRRLPSIQIKNRKLRIEFEQAEGEPLVIQPLPNQESDAWFTIDGGRVSIVNGLFRMPQANNRRYPKQFLRRVHGGEFALSQCEIHGPELDESPPPLIELTEVTDNSKRSTAIEDSALFSSGPCLSGNLGGMTVEVNNSLLASQGSAIVIKSGNRPGSIFVHHSTFSGADSSFSYQAGGGGKIIDVFVKDSVFAPSRQGSEQTAIISLSHREVVGKSIRWWESGNAYAQQIQHYLNVDGQRQWKTFESWNQLWGTGHVIDALHGPKAVLLAKPLPVWDQMTGENFALDSTCVAARWTTDGEPVGITNSIGPQNEPAQDPKQPKRPDTRRRPDF